MRHDNGGASRRMRGRLGINWWFAVAVLTAWFPFAVTAGTTSYFYDDLDRLEYVQHADNTTVGYSYDPPGNRLQKGVYPDFPVSVALSASQYDTSETMVYVLTSL